MIKERYVSKISSQLVPSGTIKKETPTGTIPCLDRVCLSRRRNSKPHRPGLPVCGDPVAAGTVGRFRVSCTLRKTCIY